MAWKCPFEVDEADCGPLVGRERWAKVGEGPGVAEFEGVGGVEEVDAFAVSVERIRGRNGGSSEMKKDSHLFTSNQQRYQIHV